MEASIVFIFEYSGTVTVKTTIINIGFQFSAFPYHFRVELQAHWRQRKWDLGIRASIHL